MASNSSSVSGPADASSRISRTSARCDSSSTGENAGCGPPGVNVTLPKKRLVADDRPSSRPSAQELRNQFKAHVMPYLKELNLSWNQHVEPAMNRLLLTAKKDVATGELTANDETKRTLKSIYTTVKSTLKKEAATDLLAAAVEHPTNFLRQLAKREFTENPETTKLPIRSIMNATTLSKRLKKGNDPRLPKSSDELRRLQLKHNLTPYLLGLDLSWSEHIEPRLEGPGIFSPEYDLRTAVEQPDGVLRRLAELPEHKKRGQHIVRHATDVLYLSSVGLCMADLRATLDSLKAPNFLPIKVRLQLAEKQDKRKGKWGEAKEYRRR